MTYNKRKILLISLCAILAIGTIILFYILAPGTKRGEKIVIDEFEIQLKDIDVQSTKGSSYPDNIKEAIAEIEDNSKIINICIDVSNLGNEDKRFAVYEFQLENGGWSNGINPDLYTESNEGSGLEPVIEGKGSKELILTYTAYPSQMNKAEWDKLDKNMKLQLDSYPQMKVLRIQ